jgi:hypothetical protein
MPGVVSQVGAQG